MDIARLSTVKATNKLEAGLRYLELGVCLVPRHGVVAGFCTCGIDHCPHPGKHAINVPFSERPTRDPSVVQDWFRHWPQMNLGMFVGERWGVGVLDFDGPAAAGDYMRRNRIRIPQPHAVALTGSGLGRRHLYYPFPVEVELPGATVLGRGLLSRTPGMAQYLTTNLPPNTGKKRRYTWL